MWGYRHITTAWRRKTTPLDHFWEEFRKASKVWTILFIIGLGNFISDVSYWDPEEFEWGVELVSLIVFLSSILALRWVNHSKTYDSTIICLVTVAISAVFNFAEFIKGAVELDESEEVEAGVVVETILNFLETVLQIAFFVVVFEVRGRLKGDFPEPSKEALESDLL